MKGLKFSSLFWQLAVPVPGQSYEEGMRDVLEIQAGDIAMHDLAGD